MGTPDPTLVYRVPGRLALNPTQNGLKAAYPHGGTALGFVRNVEIENKRTHGRILDTAKGTVIGGWADLDAWDVRFDLMQWDSDSFGLAFTVASGSIRNATPGVLAPKQPIVFSPYDVTQPACLLFAPFLFARLPMSADPRKYWLIPVDGWAATNAAGHGVQIDLLSNLSLT